MGRLPNLDDASVVLPAQRPVALQIQSLQESRPRQKPASYDMHDRLRRLTSESAAGLEIRRRFPGRPSRTVARSLAVASAVAFVALVVLSATVKSEAMKLIGVNGLVAILSLILASMLLGWSPPWRLAEEAAPTGPGGPGDRARIEPVVWW